MKETIKNIFMKLGGDCLLRKINQTPRVIFWHGADHIKNQEIEAESFDVETFKKQIDYLNNNFEIISTDEFYQRFKSQKFTNKEVVLTFDDGYLNNLEVVAPILNGYGLPFTVFISTEHIETGELFPTSIARLIVLAAGLSEISIPEIGIHHQSISDDGNKKALLLKISNTLKNEPINRVKKIVQELKDNISQEKFENLIEKYSSVKPMNWGQVEKLHKLGATIGSHCKYHICCHANQDLSEVGSQITESKKILEEKLQYECKYFAYPNGDFTEGSNKIVLAAGYKMGFSTEKIKIQKNNHLAIIPRLGAPLNINTFKIFTGLYPKT